MNLDFLSSMDSVRIFQLYLHLTCQSGQDKGKNDKPNRTSPTYSIYPPARHHSWTAVTDLPSRARPTAVKAASLTTPSRLTVALRRPATLTGACRQSTLPRPTLHYYGNRRTHFQFAPVYNTPEAPRAEGVGEQRGRAMSSALTTSRLRDGVPPRGTRRRLKLPSRKSNGH